MSGNDQHSQPQQREQPQPLTKQVFWLCVTLGVVFLTLTIASWLLKEPFLPARLDLLFVSAALGFFLTAVGGYAFGKWQGWTLGGAAATVVVLFLLITFHSPEPTQDAAEAAVVAKIESDVLYTEISAIEVMQENLARLFVAPNPRFKQALVLVEESNLDTECLAFSFVPRPRPGSVGGDSEPIDLFVPSAFFKKEIENLKKAGSSRGRVSLYYHHPKPSLLRERPDAQGTVNALSSPDNCMTRAAALPIRSDARTGSFGWVSQAFAEDLSNSELVEQLISVDALTRRYAREQIASRGPKILPTLFTAIPNPTAETYYRYALGAVVALTQMLRADFDKSDIQNKLTDSDLKKVVDLMSHQDATMRRWATAAVIRLEDQRTILPLIAMLRDTSVSPNGRYNAALALRDTSTKYPEAVQRRIVQEAQLAASTLGHKTRKLLAQLPTAQPKSTKTGWVYLGAQFGDYWSEKHFRWSGDPSTAPAKGAKLEATGNVNLRVDHIRFSLFGGWQNSDIIGLVEKGQTVTVIDSKEVHPGFFWAQIETES